MTSTVNYLDVAWLLICAAIVMLMQAGFSCLESGLVRTKNSINVAIKNFADFCVSSAIFWAFGFALMFGISAGGIVGTSEFFLDAADDPWLAAFFIFQLGFCGTATTIVSGAVAERMRFAGYLAIATLLSALIYPLMGHWAWGSLAGPGTAGWLEQIGFVDFAGSTVVHSVGGWVSLAAIIIIGPRLGRFSSKQQPLEGHDLPVAALGVFLLWFGWFGFNGGSTLALTAKVPMIILNTIISGAFGGLGALGLSWRLTGRPDAGMIMNGALAGLVGVTASAHIVEPWAAVVIGLVAASVMYAVTRLLEKLHLDDVVGAVPVHLGAGIWGTLAVALLGDPAAWNGADRWQQLAIQATGVGVAFVWAFGIGFTLLWLLNRCYPLRIDPRGEQIGLNYAEHGASTETFTLLAEMDEQRRSNDFSQPVSVMPSTEIGKIARQYNRVLDDIKAVQAKREAESRQAKETLEDAIEALPEGFVLYDSDDRLIMCNRRYREINQVSVDKLLPGTSWQDFIRTSAERRQYRDQIDDPAGFDASASGAFRAWSGEKTEYQLADGRWLLGENRRTRQGGKVGITIDITQRKELENSLRESEALIRRVLEACPIPVGMYRLTDGLVIYESPHAKALLGRDTSQPVIYARDDFVDPQQRDRYMSHIHEQGFVEELEVNLQKADGTTFVASMSAQLIDFQGQEAIVATTLDLTERREMEAEMSHQREALHQSEKLSALGELLAGVAHELNNPLTVVVGQSVLLEETAMDQEIVERAARIGKAANRCARIVKTFLSMARQQPMEQNEIDVNEIIESSIEVTGYTLRSANIDIVLDLAANIPPVRGDANMLNQVVTNLVINAQHALSESDEPRILQISTSSANDSREIVIEVRDNGSGIPDDIRSRIFEPFFTTKEIGTGTGIGLAACHRIVESHRGSISVDSNVGEGASFKVRLPVADAVAQAQSLTRLQSVDKSHPLSILVVDDVSEVAESLAEILSAENHNVEITNSVSDALAMVGQIDFDVILSDLRMNEVDGQGFYKALKADKPTLLSRLAFVTGDSVSPKARRFLQTVARPFIEKPVTPDELFDLVHRVISGNNTRNLTIA